MQLARRPPDDGRLPAVQELGDPAAVAWHAALDRVYALVLRAAARRLRPADVEAIEARTEAKLDAKMEPLGIGLPVDRLRTRFGLTARQLDYVWAVVAVTTDPRIHPHVEALAGPSARRGLGLSLYAELAALDATAARELARWLSDANPLLEHGLLRVTEDGPAIASLAIAAEDRLLSHLAGGQQPEAPVVTLTAPTDALHDARAIAALQTLRRLLAQREDLVVIIEGPVGSGRRSAAAIASAGPCLAIDARGTTPPRLELALRALRRELALVDAVPALVDVDDALGDPAATRAVSSFIAATRGPVLLVTAGWGYDVGAGRPVVRVPWTVPEVSTRTRLWQRAAPLPEAEAAELALQFPLGPAAIALAVGSARAATEGPLDAVALSHGVRHNTAERLGGLAERVEVHQTWADIVLADDTLDQVRALIARVRHRHRVLEDWGYRSKLARGVGVPALFSGPPGTGKTMVAGLIARELGLDLYQVELAQVVSKWVGETEKHLGRLFDAAQEGHALLLFDEADALFGQRSTEMKGAVDRYANLEVNYLLQRVEAFDGITILTTNLEASIDRALKRRLAAHIIFEAPDEDERILLWRRMCSTASAPLARDLDFEALARGFATMTGANIRNATLAAAYLAAADGSAAVCQDHLLRAGRAEYRSMGHILSDRAQIGNLQGRRL